MAHIGALKVIEELGVRIDYIGGTSTGAIVGGLYAVGYSAVQIDSIFKEINFSELIQDDLNTKNLHVHLQKLLMDEHTQQQLQADYAELWTALGSKNASDAAANAVLSMAQQAH